MKTSHFLTAALEELQKGPDVADVQGKDVSDVATDGAGAPGASEVHVGSDVDAIAELMEKNSSLSDSNASLETECFDNDLDVIATTSDSVQKSLDEVVSAGAALENLANTVDLAIKTGQINHASVAGFYMAFEQICERVDISNPIAAMEDDALRLEGPEGQAKAIGNSAMDKAKELGKKLIEGIKRIVGWLLNLVRQILARAQNLGKRAHNAQGLIASIDESKTIDSAPFIASLRLVEGGGAPMKQFMDYASTANKTLYGFFNRSFVMQFKDACATAANNTQNFTDEQIDEEIDKRLKDILRTLLSVIYTEHGTSADISGKIPSSLTDRDLTVGLTPPAVGGLQLYMAANIADENKSVWYCEAGAAKKPVKFDAPASIPVVSKIDAKRMLGTIESWANDQRKIENILKELQNFSNMAEEKLTLHTVKSYLSTLTALASGCIPHLLRMNVQNSASFIAYVEKSAAVSSAASTDAKK